jgi:uncharacterized protein (TIGR03435 family)
LADRFKLEIQRQKKVFPVYALIVAHGGAKLHTSEADVAKVGFAPPGLRLAFQKEPIWQLADTLSTLAFMDRPVIDMTGMSGQYDFMLDLTQVYRTDRQQPSAFRADSADTGSGVSTETSASSVFTVIQEQLGLKLEPRKVPLDVLVVQHVERVPTDN